MNIAPELTTQNVEQVLKHLELVRMNGQSMNCISIAYLKKLDEVLKHLRVRLARGEWSN